MSSVAGFDSLCEAVRSLPDPEVPVLTLHDLGVLRSMEEHDGGVVVVITPTYSGCPAMHYIEGEIREVFADAGVAVEIRTVLSPAWTTDWLSEVGREKLREYGIAPPHLVSDNSDGPTFVQFRKPVPCPRCGSANTEVVSEFGSTACKAHYRCRACAEPFDYFKEL